jgi:hypothetical protein
MTFDLLMAVASAWLITSSVWLTFRSRNWTLLLVAPLAILFFSLTQYHNWLVPFQVAFIATVFGVTICMRALVERQDRLLGWRALGFALLGAVIASLSSFGGLTVWFAFLPSVALAGRRKLILWSATAAMVIVPYMIGFPHQASYAGTRRITIFFLAYLGGPVAFPSVLGSVIVGTLSLVLMAGLIYGYWRLHAGFAGVLIWIELALFALANGLATAFGRAGVGTEAAISSRYETLSLLWWLSLVVVLGLVARDALARIQEGVRAEGGERSVLSLPLARGIVAASSVALALICLGSIMTNVVGLREGLQWQDDLVQHQDCIVRYQTASDDCIGMWFPISDKSINLAYADYLREHHYAIFSGAGSAATARGLYDLPDDVSR